MTDNEARPIPATDNETRIILLLIVLAATAVAAILATTATVVEHPAWMLLSGTGAVLSAAVAIAGVIVTPSGSAR